MITLVKMVLFIVKFVIAVVMASVMMVAGFVHAVYTAGRMAIVTVKGIAISLFMIGMVFVNLVKDVVGVFWDIVDYDMMADIVDVGKESLDS